MLIFSCALVGGEILDLALLQAKMYARFVMCGAISQYNATNPQGPKVSLTPLLSDDLALDGLLTKNLQNIFNVIAMRIKMQGFIVFDFMKEYSQAKADLTKWAAEGKLKVERTVIKGGLDVIEKAFLDLFKGVNTGKLIVEIKNPDDLSKL